MRKISFIIILSMATTLLFAASAAEYLVIGPKSFEQECQGLINLRISQGFSAAYLSTESIYANAAYNGVDPQEEIRNAIIDYYDNNDTEYVLIAGDTNLVPIRHIAVGDEPSFKKGTGTGTDLGIYVAAPTDMYYASLDGTFNYDGDAAWGELTDGDGGGQVDYVPDIAIGRIAAGSVRELRRHIAKIMQFEIQPSSTNVLLLGQELSPPTDYGGDYLDGAYNPTLGANGYTATRLYEKNAPYTVTDVHNQINSNNFEIVLNHQHASPFEVAKMFTWNGPAGLTNTVPYFFFSGGCSTNQFKMGVHYSNNRQWDSISESLTTGITSGTYAYVGHNTSGRFQESMDFLEEMLKVGLKPTVSNPRREKNLGLMLNGSKSAIFIANPGEYTKYSSDRELHFNITALGDPLSAVLKNGFTDLPTNPNILPDTAESASIRFTAPVEETVIVQGSNVTMTAANNDPAVTITNVKFYYSNLGNTAGFQHLGDSTTAPYSHTWTTPPAGDYLLRVEGYNGTTLVDDDTLFIRVAVEQKPQVTSVVFPSQLTTYNVGQPIYVYTTATDADGWIEGIRYNFSCNKGDPTPMAATGHADVAPHNGVFSAQQGHGTNTQTLTATAYAVDNHWFESAASAPTTITYTVVETNPPTIRIDAPANSAEYEVNDSITFTIFAEDTLNWKNEKGGLAEVKLDVKRISDGASLLSKTYNSNLGTTTTKTETAVPALEGVYTVTASARDWCGITRETSITIEVLDPNKPLDFEDPSFPWTSNNATLTLDTTVKTEGNASLRIDSQGYMVINSAVFATSDIGYYSNELSVDIYVPSPQTDPGWFGQVQLFTSAPSANWYNQPSGQVELTGLTAGAWNTIKLALPAGFVNILAGNATDIQFHLVLNTNQNGDRYRFDNLRFTGTRIYR